MDLQICLSMNTGKLDRGVVSDYTLDWWVSGTIFLGNEAGRAKSTIPVAGKNNAYCPCCTKELCPLSLWLSNEEKGW
ncbi:hypothetical protein J2Z65_001881 [Paenibacillus aceris]|uniref:Uncharacterized protein n=1 Tax=Paenibacillus aceris TaxID=869555 RepID=A0ABS4HVN4_9BACL|nr:hypothetical protein [Paenibacillus aceris]